MITYKLLTKRVYRKTLASITASIKPQTEYSSLLEMVRCGVTIFRINFSWFKKPTKALWTAKLKEIEKIAIDKELVLGIMLDTKGPEFRVCNLNSGATRLDRDPDATIYEPGKEGFIYEPNKDIRLTLDTKEKTNSTTICVDAPLKTKFMDFGTKVVFGDGDYEAFIRQRRSGDRAMVISPEGPMCVWDGMKVNFPGTPVSARALGSEDREILQFFLRQAKKLDKRVNFIFAQSFIKAAEDVENFRTFLRRKGVTDPVIVAKLETYESARHDNLERIIEHSSGVMIARGDLANQTSREALPKLQREIIKVAKQFNKSVLLATHVYGSMKDFRRSKCARPEAEDVRSALELGVDGFVLTEETTGRPDPEKVVKALASQIQSDEIDLITQDQRDPSGENHYEKLREVERVAFHKRMRTDMRDPNLPIDKQRELGTTDFAIAAVFRANEYGAIGLFPFTFNGRTVREMCRFYPETEIFPVTHVRKIIPSLLLCRCAHPVLVEVSRADLKNIKIDDFKEMVRDIVNELDLGERKPNARYAICTMAHPPLEPGGTDTLLRLRVDE